MKTSEEFHRDNLSDLISKILKDRKLILEPVKIKYEEDFEPSRVITSFSFRETQMNETRLVKLDKIKGTGFVDCVFSACLLKYKETYPSLGNVMLLDLLIKPVFSKSRKSIQSDAATDVILQLQIPGRGTAEFKNRSTSLVGSSYNVILSAFQFYINCEKSMRHLKFLVKEASDRNRIDLVDSYSYKMSCFTNVNCYEKVL